MQDESSEASASISQLLRESYLAERTIHNGNSGQSSSDSLHPLCYGHSDGLSEEVKCLDDLSDLSAFLSQEELDKSVNLAIQEIDKSPHEITQDEHQKHVIYPTEELKETLKSSSNKQAHHLAHVPASSEKVHRPDNGNICQEQLVRATNVSKETSQEMKKGQSNNPHVNEKESKKEFRNKAADFIEELSSLFKTHNSKNIRPKTCKKNRSKRESKSSLTQGRGADNAILSNNRERNHNAEPIEVVEELEAQLQILKNEEVKDVQNATELKTTEVSPGSSLTSLSVEEAISQPPNFIQKLKSREIEEGAKVQLDCVVVGIPVPEVRWYCEGRELENSPDIQIIQAGNVQSLVISEAFQEDTGRYSCFASNIHGIDSTSAEIYIEGASSSESEGDLCKENIDQAQKMASEIDAVTVGSPHLSSSVIHQQVHKEVQAPETPMIKDESSLPVQPQSQIPANYLQGLDGKPLIAAPVFTKMLQDLSASEGQLIVFECRVKGAPSPKVEWYREGSLIEDSPDFRILQKKPRSAADPEEMCTLVIAEVFSEDSGTFTCTASNKYGTVSSIAHLHVKDSQDSGVKAALPTSAINAEAFKHQSLPSNSAYVLSNPTNPLLDPPTRLKLEGVLVNHNEPRSTSKAGLRVHFKLPEDDKGSEVSSDDATGSWTQLQSDMSQEIIGKSFDVSGAGGLLKEPPPVLAKPKLGPVQLQLLHHQVLLEQQQLQPPSPQQSSFDMSTLNTLSSSIQQSSSTSIQQTQLPPPDTFTYTRPKVFLSSQKTNVFPPSCADVRTPSPISERMQSPSFFPSPDQLQGRAMSPTSTPQNFRIQDPAAFLSSVLPSLPAAPPTTNSMGLPRSAPKLTDLHISKKTPKTLRLDLVRDKNAVMDDLQRKLYFKDDISIHQQEYKISSFEQRLMNEIEFRLERTPVDESDEEVHHDEIPTGKCIAPIFDKRLKHFRVTEGTAVTFTCKVVGIPMPKVYWFKDGKQISKKNEHCKIKREADGACLLHIENATNDDDGNYTIMAANPQGKISCSGHLLVQTTPMRVRMAPTLHSHRVRSRLQEMEGEPTQNRFFRPHFLQAPGDMVAHEGRLCRLDCKVSGLPTPDLIWLLNGKHVLPDATHRMLIRENGIHSLIIDPIMQKDAGTYTCIATNKTGQNAFNLELNVVAKEVKKTPVFLEKLQNSGVPEGHSVRLESRVVGMPPPVFYWKKDNETIPWNDQRVSMHQDTTGYVCLYIQPTKKDDAGWYTLSAKNDAGIVSCTARLDIYAQWYQQIPQQIKKVRSSGSRYATLTGQGLDILSAFPSMENPVESEEL